VAFSPFYGGLDQISEKAWKRKTGGKIERKTDPDGPFQGYLLVSVRLPVVRPNPAAASLESTQPRWFSSIAMPASGAESI
jgi:hypothetical protein